MKIFDMNTAIGHWPFRQIPHQTPETLRQQLESRGISAAAAANTHGVFYKNTHDANHELNAALASHRDFFTGIATLNPLYPQWEKDLRQCVEEFKFKALRLLPLYHNYDLTGREASAIIRAAGNLRIPVIIPFWLVDNRQMHWMDISRPQDFEAVKIAAIEHPQTDFIFAAGCIAAPRMLDKSGNPLPNLYIESSRYRSARDGILTLAELVKTIGADHILFGSGAPFREVTPALIKLENAAITTAEKNLIAHGNFKRVLKYAALK
jgi:predicted TIM-barrel fold metal-dependent hydrolase